MYFYLNTYLPVADIKEVPTDIHRASLKRCTSLYKEATPYATAVNSISYDGSGPKDLAPRNIQLSHQLPLQLWPLYYYYMDVAQTYYVVALYASHSRLITVLPIVSAQPTTS